MVLSSLFRFYISQTSIHLTLSLNEWLSSSELNMTPNNILKSRLTDETYIQKCVKCFFLFIGKEKVTTCKSSRELYLFREIIDADCRFQQFASNTKNKNNYQDKLSSIYINKFTDSLLYPPDFMQFYSKDIYIKNFFSLVDNNSIWKIGLYIYVNEMSVSND